MLSRQRSVAASAVALWMAILIAAFYAPLRAQEAPVQAARPPISAAAEVQAAELDSLLTHVRERFQLYPLRDGVMLLPKYEAPTVQSVQVAGGTIAVNGRTLAGAEIPALLGEDAPLVLRLSYLPPEQLARRAAETEPEAVAPTAPAGPAAGAPAGEVAPDTGAVGGAAPTGTIADADTAAAPRGAPEAEEEVAEAEDEEEEAAEDETEAELDPDFFSDERDEVRMGSDIRVADGDTVGDVVSIGGDVDVAGTVLGDAVSIGGLLRLRDTAEIHGDAVSVGGRMEKAPGAEVRGETTTVSMSFPFLAARTFAWDGGGLFDALGGLLFTFLWVALLLIVGSIFILFLNRPLDRVETNLRSSPLKAGLVGFLAQLLFLPIYIIGLVLLVITIIGIPVAILWAIGFCVVGFIAALFGFTAAARATGHFFSNRLDRPLHSPYVALFIGLVILFLPILIGDIFGFGPGLMDLFSVLFFIIGSIILYVVFTIGFGAVILTRFGTRTTWSGEPPAEYGAPAAPPPAPTAPAGEPLREPSYSPLPEVPAGRLRGESAGRLTEGYGGKPHPESDRNDRPPPV